MKKPSKRAMIAALVTGLIAAGVSLGYLDSVTAATISAVVIAWIVGDTVRPSGTVGLGGGSGPAPGN